MGFEEDLVAGLLADAAYAASIDSRLSWGERNRGEGLPATTIQLASGQFDYCHDGPVDLQASRIQFDIWGATELAVLQVKRLLVPAAHGLVGTTHGITRFTGAFLVMDRNWPKQERAEGDPDSRITLHFNIAHHPAA